jgi:outer membrane protein
MYRSSLLRLRVAVVAVTTGALPPMTAFGQVGRIVPLSRITAQPTEAPDETVARRLSMDDAVRLALEQNLSIQSERLTPQIQDAAVAQARSFWSPQLSTGVSSNSSNIPSGSALSGGLSAVSGSSVATSLGVNQMLPTGASYSLGWNGSRGTSTNIFNTFNPQLQSSVSLNVSQPLVRNFKIDAIRQQVAISKKQRDSADVQLHTTVVQATSAVKTAYWELAFQIDNLAAQRQSLELAQQLLKDNERRVQIGTLAPIDIVEAQLEVARNEESVIVGEAAIKQAQDQLRALIFNPATTPDFWNISIEPADTALRLEDVDIDGAVRNALDKRTDLQQAKNSLAQSDVNIRYFRNQILPDVSAIANYSSYSLGGVQLQPLNSVPSGPVDRTIVSQRAFGSVLSDVLTSAYPTWTVGVSVGYPLGTSTQQTNLARAKLQYAQAQTQLKNLELQVAIQVRQAARTVQTNQRRVETARAVRELAETRLDAEQKKFAAGIETPFFVFQAQRDLAMARTNEVIATSDYNKSRVSLEAVQEVSIAAAGGGPGIGGGGAGGGGTLTTAGSGAIQTGTTIVRQSQ